MAKLIAIIDDEPDILDIVSFHLKESGYTVREFPNAGGLWDFLKVHNPNLIILDVKLPDADGFDVCRSLKTHKKYSHIPIIMLTGKGTEVDKVLGLELGADDYVTKPFSARELTARVKAVLRRGKKKEIDILQIGGVEVDMQKFEVTYKGKKILLTPTEFRILKILAQSQGRIFSRQQILDELWGSDKVVVDRTIDVHIKNIKKKLGPARTFIKNVRGVGYKVQE
ncbi:MAG: response regulator transcription factor [candidate division WOR-3 bacterium]|nr:MAG: response regulator transcription factor [candidate division WOR-3 bacterium]